jgi:hypothetical protein
MTLPALLLMVATSAGAQTTLQSLTIAPPPDGAVEPERLEEFKATEATLMEELRKLLRAQIHQLAECGPFAAQGEPTTEGTVVFRIEISERLLSCRVFDGRQRERHAPPGERPTGPAVPRNGAR